MTGKGKDQRGDRPAAKGARDARRDARLGAALRQNLLRRKARARALDAPTEPDAPTPDTPAKDP